MAVGEAGELKGLKGSTSSPVLQDRGFSFSPYGTGYILSGADPPPVIDDSALARGLSLRRSSFFSPLASHMSIR